MRHRKYRHKLDMVPVLRSSLSSREDETVHTATGYRIICDKLLKCEHGDGQQECREGVSQEMGYILCRSCAESRKRLWVSTRNSHRQRAVLAFLKVEIAEGEQNRMANEADLCIQLWEPGKGWGTSASLMKYCPRSLFSLVWSRETGKIVFRVWSGLEEQDCI